MAPEPVNAADLEALQAALDKALRNIGRAIERGWDKFDGVVDRGAVLAATYGAAATAYIHDALVELRAQLERLLDLAADVIANGTPVVSLFTECLGWLSQVMQPASEIASRSDKPQDENLPNWVGNAAGAYRAKVAVQRAALDKTVENAALMSQWLAGIGQANVDYATGLLSKIAAVVLELAEACGLFALAQPTAVGSLTSTVKGSVQLALDELGELAKGIARMIGEMRDLSQAQMRHTEFEGGDWPQAVHHLPAGPVTSTADPQFRTA